MGKKSVFVLGLAVGAVGAILWQKPALIEKGKIVLNDQLSRLKKQTDATTTEGVAGN